MHDLNDLAILARLADRLSFDAAARDLGLSASTVSRRIAALEARLGVPLVLRTTRSVRLTAAGSTYAERCREVVAAGERADALARTHLDVMQGDLAVNAPTLFGHMVLMPIIAEFALAYPDVRVLLTLNNARIDLNAESVDLAIRTGELPDSGLRVRRLAVTPFVVVASPGCLARHGTPTTIAEFAALPCLAFDRGGELNWCTGSKMKPVKIAACFVADDHEALRDAAIAGVGFALLPYFAAASALEDGRLVAVSLDHDFGETPVSLVFPGHKVPNRCAKTLADAILSAVGRCPNWKPLRGSQRVEGLAWP